MYNVGPRQGPIVCMHRPHAIVTCIRVRVLIVDIHTHIHTSSRIIITNKKKKTKLKIKNITTAAKRTKKKIQRRARYLLYYSIIYIHNESRNARVKHSSGQQWYVLIKCIASRAFVSMRLLRV